jgi:ferredoxin-NADP reductase
MTAVLPARQDATAPRRRLSPMAVFEALATPHGVDRYLELVHPMLTVREIRAEVTDVTRTTGDSVTLTLRPTRQWRGFAAGQFVQISVDIDGVRRTRCYSPCSSQHRADGRFQITVKAHADGLVSRYLHARAHRGMVVGLSQADGTFRLPDQRPEKVLLISGGSGITPVLSMLRTLCDEGFDGDVAFLHYAPRQTSVSCRDDLLELAAAHPNVRLVFACTREPGSVSGHFAPEHLATVAPWYRDAHTYVCGPAGLMSAVGDHFTACGLADRLHTEAFTLAPVAVPASEASGTVRFARSGTEAPNTGAPLLEQAEAAGLQPEFGCRMGICFSCTKVKTSGCTRDLRTGEVDADPDREIQLCVSVPVGDVALDL